MNLIQSLFVRGAQEAGELVGVFAQLAAMGPKAVDQTDAAPIVSAEDGEDGAGESMGQPLVLKAIKEMNEILAAVELLRDRGVPLAGIGDPVAVGEAKNMIVKSMEQSMADGQLVLTDDDKNPRPEGVNEPGTGLPEDGAGGDGDANGEGSGDGGYDDGSAGGAADGDQAGDTSGGDTGEDGSGEGDGTGDDTGGDGDLGDDSGSDGAGDGGEGDTGDGQGDEGDGSDGDDGNTDGDDDEGEEEEEEEDESGSNDV